MFQIPILLSLSVLVACQTTTGHDADGAAARKVIKEEEEEASLHTTITSATVTDYNVDTSSNSQQQQQQERNLIINGQEADASRYPYFALMVSLHFPLVSCGGTLVHEDFVLSSAHCVEIGMDRFGQTPTNNNLAEIANNLRVFVGNIEEHPTDRTIKKGIEVVDIFIHPDYDVEVSRTDNDLVLLKLGQPFKQQQSSRSSPRLLLNREKSFPSVSQQVTVIGYGATNTSGPEFPDNLQEVTLETVDMGQCEAIYTTIHEADRDICAFGPGTPPRDACFGDSGGPLLVLGANSNNTHKADVQVGIVAHGPEEIEGLDVTFPCANPSYPGVYVRVSAYVDWIDEIICKFSSNPPSSSSFCQTFSSTPSVTPSRTQSGEPTTVPSDGSTTSTPTTSATISSSTTNTLGAVARTLATVATLLVAALLIVVAD